MEPDYKHSDKTSSLDSSKDPFMDLSDLKRKVLLKYTNHDLYLANIKDDIIPGKTLFFPYSGLEVHESLFGLDYSNIILADGQLFSYSCDFLNNGRKHVISIDLDPIMVVMMMLDLNVKIDCFVGIKDDIHSDNFSFMLEMLIPLFTDKLVYVSSKRNRVGPFRSVNDNVKKLPFKTNIHIESDYFDFFRDDSLKETHNTFGGNYDVVLLEKPSNKCKVSLINGKRVNLVQDSIWRYVDMLDLSFIEYDTFQQEIINQNYDNIFNVRGKYETDDGLELDLYEPFDIQVVCNMRKAKVIGFNHNWRNKEQIRLLLEPNNGLRELYLFFPDNEQYMELYFIHWEDLLNEDL